MERYRIREDQIGFYVQKFIPASTGYFFSNPERWEDVINYFPSFSCPKTFLTLKDAKEWIKEKVAEEIKFKNGDIIHEYDDGRKKCKSIK
jgi:hypothetical protein